MKRDAGVKCCLFTIKKTAFHSSVSLHFWATNGRYGFSYLLMQWSWSNFNLRLPDAYLVLSYLIATVSNEIFFWDGNSKSKNTFVHSHVLRCGRSAINLPLIGIEKRRVNVIQLQPNLNLEPQYSTQTHKKKRCG